MILDTETRTAVAPRTDSPSLLRRAVYSFFSTPKDTTSVLLRMALAATMFPHGAQKALGWFGGHGFSNTVGFFVQNGTPAPLAMLIIAAEFLGPIALVAGFFTRWSAFGIGLVMAGALGLVHAQNGFFMNWMGNQKGEGFEYFIPVIAIAIVLMVKGAGRWAVDGLIAERVAK